MFGADTYEKAKPALKLIVLEPPLGVFFESDHEVFNTRNLRDRNVPRGVLRDYIQSCIQFSLLSSSTRKHRKMSSPTFQTLRHIANSVRNDVEVRGLLRNFGYVSNLQIEGTKTSSETPEFGRDDPYYTRQCRRSMD